MLGKNQIVQALDIETTPKPKVCVIDISDDVFLALRDCGINLIKGTLGSKVRVPKKNPYDSQKLVSNYEFPENLHEYDIVIIDLNNFNTKNYFWSENTKESHAQNHANYFVSRYPQTLFDPRPFGAAVLKMELDKMQGKKHIIICFGSDDYTIDYETVSVIGSNESNGENYTINIYSFSDAIQLGKKMYGEEVVILNEFNADLYSLLERNKNGIKYHQTFKIPMTFNGFESKVDQSFSPLITNTKNEIISFVKKDNYFSLYVFPQISSQDDFLKSFLQQIAPSIHPEIFPYATKYNWKKEPIYWLPNHKELVDSKRVVELEYEQRILEFEKAIAENTRRYSFLHDMLIESGDNLVKAIIKYLSWLGFSGVTEYDSISNTSTIFEEDIQIAINEGLLIIECKGLGGTSTDANCSQISKIKHRRCKERKSFDVYALYIVNHQRHLPPLTRKNPPFTDTQVNDALHDERGLLTTWQLFKLYFDIESGLISKSEAMKTFLNFGLIEFKPTDLVFVYEPSEILKGGTVCIVKIKDVELYVGEQLIIESSGDYSITEILEIRQSDMPVTKTKDGEYGLLLGTKIGKKSKIWKKVIR
ncbi:hypothetical protein [Flavihumibacter profundi]|uniref:hypothetical protein n=1 Tax=Flavihumibacter profundi TaxID=2716883 RepID=UPI001CC4F069|nr:hypothetical protein [Flavihumibacter profundi]MBZ5859432.1 hypothetical protein [Flavihumibacter profundi]